MNEIKVSEDLNIDINNKEYKSTRDGYGQALLTLGEVNKGVVVLTADLPNSTRTNMFKEMFPERFFDCGVAEQNMAGVSAGLALSGKIPFMSSFGVFSPGRNWEQIRVSICYSNANVKIVSTHTGLGVGEDGASHQALEDIAITRVLPNLIVLSPVDFNETKKAVIASTEIDRPVYIRLTRQAVKSFTTDNTPFKIGKAYKYIEGSDITIFSTGAILEFSINAAIELSKLGISAEVINVPTIKPLDEETIIDSVKKTKCAITVEDHQIHGGFGSAIAELLAEKFPIRIGFIGMHDSFGESGNYMDLYRKYGLTTNDIIKKAQDILNSK